MGWKINIVDDFNKRYLITSGSGAQTIGFEPTTLVLILISFCVAFF
jgi:hypothetical protein